MLARGEAVELAEIRARGFLAMAFAVRQQPPNEQQWQMLRGSREITMRDIGEIAHELSFEVSLMSTPVDRPDDMVETKD